jgi:hypothetical protein
MARQRGVIKLQGTIAGLSFVNSKTYGAHVRAARGTHKKATINEVLQGNVEKAKTVTTIGSPVLRAMKELEKGFASGDLWARMMRQMLRTKSTLVSDLFESIQGMEVNERYSFGTLFPVLPGFEFSFKKNQLFVEMELLSHARFSREVKANCYLCEVLVLFFDGKEKWTTDRMETEWISFHEHSGVYEMEFKKPKGAKYFLAIAGAKAGRDEKEIKNFRARGYRICGWGKS